MTPRKHQLEMFWLGVTFTLLHFVSPVMWPFYTLTGFMLFLWAANVALDWYERRQNATIAAMREQFYSNCKHSQSDGEVNGQ